MALALNSAVNVFQKVTTDGKCFRYLDSRSLFTGFSRIFVNRIPLSV